MPRSGVPGCRQEEADATVTEATQADAAFAHFLEIPGGDAVQIRLLKGMAEGDRAEPIPRNGEPRDTGRKWREKESLNSAGPENFREPLVGLIIFEHPEFLKIEPAGLHPRAGALEQAAITAGSSPIVTGREAGHPGKDDAGDGSASATPRSHQARDKGIDRVAEGNGEVPDANPGGGWDGGVAAPGQGDSGGMTASSQSHVSHGGRKKIRRGRRFNHSKTSRNGVFRCFAPTARRVESYLCVIIIGVTSLRTLKLLLVNRCLRERIKLRHYHG